MRELVRGKNTIGRTAAVLKKPHKATFLTLRSPFNVMGSHYVLHCSVNGYCIIKLSEM